VVARLGDLQVGQAEEVGDRLARDFDPEGVDDDNAADARRSGQRHLGGDPPPMELPVTVTSSRPSPSSRAM
jgi:hypothetical protein